MTWHDRPIEEFDYPMNLFCVRCHRTIELKPHYESEDEMRDDLEIQDWEETEEGWICHYCRGQQVEDAEHN